MAGILNITPCRGVVNTEHKEAQVVGELDTKAAINISSDSTGTAFPKMTGGTNDADYYMLVCDADMYIRIDVSTTKSALVAIGDTYIPSGVPLFIGRQAARGYIAKLDK